MYHDPLYTLAFGTDASFYRLIPQLVIKALNEEEIAIILKECSALAIPVTFRAAGTSLSGQSVTDSVLVIAAGNWKEFSISADRSVIKLQPGLTGGKVNTILSPFHKKIGPDPASINSAMIGGIAANNASGMCCGTSMNSYRTVAGIRIIFADGTILDTSDTSSRELFRKTHSEMLSGISELAESAMSDTELAARIRKKYRMKNTTGYSLNALVDFTDPFEIIEHLMIGSEGTLGFISEIALRTVTEYEFRASSLMLFPDTGNACKAVVLMKNTPVSAVELIDRAGLRSVEDEIGMPSFLKYAGPDVCALLVETVASDKTELKNNIYVITDTVKTIPVAREIEFTDLPEEYELLWKIRKGLFPSVGAMRKTGTTVIIEDVAFPVEKLAEATGDLQQILRDCGYYEAVIFGHALEGNLHFVFTQDFSTQEEINRYSRLMTEVARLVTARYDGSLKAEHGTGRNMAPFVEMEWGSKAYELMKRIKKIFDPDNILNPGVILNDDDQVYLKNLKPLPPANHITDKCTECGFCEISCVSAGLTLTPRQRIAVYRELSSLRSTGSKPHIAAAITKQYAYAGNNTCATDGLCAVNCPAKIDTGKMIKELRSEIINDRTTIAELIASHMDKVTAFARYSLNVVDFFHTILGPVLMKTIANGLRSVTAGIIPAWNRYMPAGAKKIRPHENDNTLSHLKKVVYFPSCINRSMGLSKDQKNDKQLTEKMHELLRKGGYDAIYPENMDNLCCGMAFMSKGYTETGKRKSEELRKALMIASNNGEYPVLCDMSPCLFTMKENIDESIRLYEPVGFILEYLIPNLVITQLDETVSVFPVCSMKKMGLEGKLSELARLCAKNVIVPDTNCCGFAGDRGFTYPELNRHGLKDLANQTGNKATGGYSTSRTCEIGLSMYSEISYRSIVYLVDKASAPKKQDTT